MTVDRRDLASALSSQLLDHPRPSRVPPAFDGLAVGKVVLEQEREVERRPVAPRDSLHPRHHAAFLIDQVLARTSVMCARGADSARLPPWLTIAAPVRSTG